MLRRYYLTISLLGLMLTGCMDQDDPGHQTPRLYDVVVLESAANPGAVFSLSRDDNAPTYLSAPEATINNDMVALGDALVIYYSVVESRQSAPTPITLYRYYPITNGAVKEYAHEDLASWRDDPVYLISLWRSGSRLNMECRLPYDTTPRLFTLAVDRTTLDSAMPDVYLLHRRDEATPTFDRRYYASFDISSLTNNPAFAGFTLHVADTNLNATTYPFTFAR